MSEMTTLVDGMSVPGACVLPTTGRHIRLTEIDDHVGPSRMLLEPRPDPAMAAPVADLVTRGSQCCPFFALALPGHGWPVLGRRDAGVIPRRAGRQRGKRLGYGDAVSAQTGLRSGQVATAAGVNLQTLRYYERRGLLAEPDRSLGGHRLYPAEAVTVLRVMKAAQRLGFTLDEVAELLEAGRHRHAGRSDAVLAALAAAKLVEVDTRIADLAVIRDTLRAALAAGCDDLVACMASPCCPLPFAELAHARVQQPRTAPCGGHR